jgi:hypothetical protein
MISPSHRVGPMLPRLSNTWCWGMPRNQSRRFQPMGVGSRAGSSAATGGAAAPPPGSSLARAMPVSPCRSHDRDVGAGQEEQGGPHGHPAHEGAPAVHRGRHVGQGRGGAAGEYRQVNRSRAGRVQRKQRVSHRFRGRRVAAEVVPAHHGLPSLPHRDGSSRHSSPPSLPSRLILMHWRVSILVHIDICVYRLMCERCRSTPHRTACTGGPQT